MTATSCVDELTAHYRHLLAKLEGAPSLVYAQVPYATPEEIGELVQLILDGEIPR